MQDLEQARDDEAIITAVISLGRSLNLQVTAEGVETVGQAQRLREMGRGCAQGYYLAQPMAGVEVPDLISTWYASRRDFDRLRAKDEPSPDSRATARLLDPAFDS